MKILFQKSELENLYQQKANTLEDIYKIRYDALNRKLNNEELARLLIHLAQRRGFKSNRKDETDKEGGKLLKATEGNKKLMAERKYLTVGEMLYKDEKFSRIKRNKGGDYSNTFLRRQIEEEVDIIFQKQKEYGNDLITDTLTEKYKDILFSQRDFAAGPASGPYSGDQIEKMIGKCTLENGEKRAAKATYTFEKFNLLQKINSISISCEGTKRKLSPDEREKVNSLCHKTENITYARIREELGLSDIESFGNLNYKTKDNGTDDTEKKTNFKYLPAYHEMRKAFDKLKKGYIQSVSVEKRDAIGYALTCFKTDDRIKDYLVNDCSDLEFTDAELEIIQRLKSFSKFGNLSIKAMRKITPYLEQGDTYDKACENAGYNFKAHNNGSKTKYLPPLSDDDKQTVTNPVVKRAVNQTIKVINAIVKKYGPPAAVNIELARDTAKSHKEREEITKSYEQNATNNEKLADEIRTTYGIKNPSGQDILKLKLRKEQDFTCLYTSTKIQAEHLFDAGWYEIDHIIPYSISFNDSYRNKVLVTAAANREKGNRLPMQYVKNPDGFKGLVLTFIRDKKKVENLLKANLTPEEEESLKQRSLQDTQFITRFIQNYIVDHLLFDESYDKKKKVTAVNGTVTDYMRKRWGIKKIRENGDLHHSIDAAVVACVTDGTIQKVTKYYQIVYDRDGNYIRHKNFPLPWPEFRTELDIRTCKNPARLLADVNLPNYQDVDIEKIKPVFVSRMTKKKRTGAAHMDTVRSCKEIDGQKQLVSKTPLQKLKLDKNGEIGGYYNPDSDRLLYNLLKEKLTAAGGDGKKAFPDGYVYKPTPNGGVSPKVKSVKTYEKSSLNVSVHKGKGLAENGSMLRIDIFKVEGDGYYFVPIYVSDMIKDTLPNKAVVQGKSYEDWKEMKDEDFLFSVYPNDLLLVKHKRNIKFAKNLKDSNIDNEYNAKEEFVYYISAGISVGTITVINHDNSYIVKSLGIKTLESIEKCYVDVLGNIYKAGRETRKK